MGIIMDLLFGRKLTQEELLENARYLAQERVEKVMNYVMKRARGSKPWDDEIYNEYKIEEQKFVQKIWNAYPRELDKSLIDEFIRYREDMIGKNHHLKTNEFIKQNKLLWDELKIENRVKSLQTDLGIPIANEIVYEPEIKKTIENDISSSYNPKYFPSLKPKSPEKKDQLDNMMVEDIKAEEFNKKANKEIDNELSLLKQRKAELEARVALKKTEKEQWKG